MSGETSQLAGLLSAAGVATWEWNARTDRVSSSQGIAALFGLPLGDFAKSYEEFLALVHPDDRHLLVESIGGVLEGKAESYALEHRVVWPDGSTHWLACKGLAEREPDGSTRTIAGVVFDITASKGTQEALAESEELLRSSMEHSPIGMAIVAPDGRFLRTNPAFETLVGYARDELLAGDFQAITHPDDVDADLALLRESLAGLRSTYQMEKRYVRKSGESVWAQLNVSLVRNANGSPRYFVSQVQDIRERRAAEAAVRDSEEKLRQLAESLREVVWLRDVARDRMLYVSPIYERTFGRPAAELMDDPTSRLSVVHRDDLDRVVRSMADQSEQDIDVEYRILVGGAVRWIHERGFRVLDADGQVSRIAGTAEDVTERRRIEEQLNHSQKMDAFGQLAGGVAHDFNNLLAVILPHAQLSARIPGLDARVRESLAEIGDAARRAARLTRQLLQLSRRDVLRPRVVDLGEAVTRFATMLRRLLREDVTLNLRLVPEPSWVLADPSLLDQVMMNLAVNARDAMPDGGTLTIETALEVFDDATAAGHPSLAPGAYVCLRVSDTGHGVADADLPRLFEPFFTTKPPGKGTGLGLATVSGIVQQHSGIITVDTTLGGGTTFSVFLPRREPDEDHDPELPPNFAPKGGSETVLVVEDDGAVRATTALTLRRHGYEVLTAMDGAEALRTLAERKDIALVVTDLVMPGKVSGRALVEQLHAKHAATKVVITSGYSPEVFGRELDLREGVNFVAKPVSVTTLLDIVRRTLDEG